MSKKWTYADLEKTGLAFTEGGYPLESAVFYESTPKASKFKNVRREYKGMKFASKKEMCRYITLEKLQEMGEISDLRRQVEYLLVEDVSINYTLSYIADHVYYSDGLLYVEDVKPSKKTKEYYQTQTFKQKKRLMFEKYGIKIKLF